MSMKKLDEILSESGFGSVTSGAETPEASFFRATPDESDEGPECALCAGARFVRRNLPLDHPDFGRAFPCSCVADEEEDQRHSNLGPLVRLGFDNLIPTGRSSNPHDQQSFGHCLAAARGFADAPDGWLVLSGPSGAGKTHIAAAITNRLIENGRAALFVVVPDLLDHLRSAYSPKSELPYDQLFEQVKNAPILVLDDLGTQSMTPWTQEKLFQLINHRFNAQLPTVFTTNLRPTELPERMRTRLTDTSLARVFELETSGLLNYNELSTLDLPLLRNMTFQRFDPRGSGLSEESGRFLQEAHRQALSFAEEPQDWLVFVGDHGSGKTHLAAAIANKRRQNGDSVLFVVVPDLLDHLRRSFGPQESAPDNHELFERVRAAPLLVLDDFGAQSQSPWADEKLYQLINFRYNARLPTVITTSMNSQQMDTRILSRITDPALSTILPTGRFDFGGGRAPDPSQRRRSRSR
ncbi:MAG: AAA family ATPase [Dehalococcoidia bacterium]|nr:AAA family ATPase [Dehalococcoidia bacterium]